MRVKNFFTILIAFGLLVNCSGLGKDKKDSGLDKNAENLLLADYLNLANNLNETKVEYLEINGKWRADFGENSYIFYIFAEKNAFFGFRGFWEDFTIRLIVEFDNNTKTLYAKQINEPFMTDCNGNGTNGEPGVECYSRIVWTKYNNKYYYYEVVYGKGSLEQAKSDPATADSTEPEERGCGGSRWTKFEEKLD